MSAPGAPHQDAAGRALRETQRVALALALAPVLLMVPALLVPLAPAAVALVFPVGLIGLISPVIAYRLYHYQRERAASAAVGSPDPLAFRRAVIVALAVSESAAVLAVVVFWLSGRFAALTGLATHVIVAGALWPSPEKLEAFR